jgi:hypothetical protein
MELNVQFKLQQHVLMDFNLFQPIALHKQILYVLMEGYGMDQLVLFKLKVYVQVDIDLMWAFVQLKLLVHVHLDII